MVTLYVNCTITSYRNYMFTFYVNCRVTFYMAYSFIHAIKLINLVNSDLQGKGTLVANWVSLKLLYETKAVIESPTIL